MTELVVAALGVSDKIKYSSLTSFFSCAKIVANGETRRTLEAMMKGYVYQTEFAKKYVAEGHANGLVEGLTRGRAEGFTEGFTKGHSEVYRGTHQRAHRGTQQGAPRRQRVRC